MLYNQTHPFGDENARIFNHDKTRNPDLLCVMGTSLSIESLNSYVRLIAKEVQNRGGIAIFVNKDPPTSGWQEVFNYYIKCEVDTFAIQFAHVWSYNRAQEWEDGEKGEHTQDLTKDHKPVKISKVDSSLS
jgi:NAD+-dependent protein deacetylase SIR2